MGRGKPLTMEEIGRINAWKLENLSLREISRRLSRSAGVVRNYLQDPENYEKNRKGRTKRATTSPERRRILREASNSCSSARKVASIVGTNASVRTVQRILQRAPSIKRMKLKRKPALKDHHKRARLDFAQQHMSWTTQWESVIFTDEKKFNLDGPDGFSFYYHDLRKEQRYLSRRHSGVGSVMIWGAICYVGTIDLVILEGKQNARSYKNLLEREKLKITEVMEGQKWIYQHDNASIHAARIVKEWFEEENIETLRWPALSPDLNIIENVWGWLARKIYGNGRQFENRNQLIEAIKKAWNEIPKEYIEKLYKSVPKRIFELIKNSGSYTHY